MKSFILSFIGIFFFLQTVTAQSDQVLRDSLADGHGSRYFLMPTAIPTPKGASSLQLIGLGTVNYHRGLTRHVSASAGIDGTTLLLSLTSRDFTGSAFGVNVKAGTTMGKRWHIAAGTMVNGVNFRDEGVSSDFLPDLEANLLVGRAYGLLTYGDHRQNLTLGLSWRAERSFGAAFDVSAAPMLSLGGQLQVDDHLAFVTENHIYSTAAPDSYSNVDHFHHVFFSAGIRAMWDRYHINLGLWNGLKGIQYEGLPFNQGADLLINLPLPYFSVSMRL